MGCTRGLQLIECCFICAQPAKRVGGLFGRAKAAAKDAAEDAKDAVGRKSRAPVFGLISRGMAAANVRAQGP